MKRSKERAPDAVARTYSGSAAGGPSRLFILRPVATALLMAAILLAGITSALSLLPSPLLPGRLPTIQVVTLCGASRMS